MALLVDSFEEGGVLSSIHVSDVLSVWGKGIADCRELIEPSLRSYEKFVHPMELPIIPLRPYLRFLVYSQQIQVRLHVRVRGGVKPAKTRQLTIRASLNELSLSTNSLNKSGLSFFTSSSAF